jgi:hypothetical protein
MISDGDLSLFLHGGSTLDRVPEVVDAASMWRRDRLIFHESTLSTTTGVYLLRKKA